MKPFKLSFIIDNNPELVLSVLKAFRNDPELSKTFEGSIKNGLISGTYSMLALINGMVIGYVKVEGVYSKEKGDLTIEIKPNLLFWFLHLFLLIGGVFAAFISTEKWIVNSFLIVFSALLILFFFIDSNSFIKKLKHIKV